MTGRLDEALRALLAQELPALFGGATPAVEAAVSSDQFEIDPGSVDAQASEPRPGDRTDALPFDSAHPEGPYTLTQSPLPGPRRVRLSTALGDRIPLGDAEVQFDPLNARQFTLQPRADRDLASINAVQVLYGVTAVFTGIKYLQDLALVLQATDGPAVDRAEALAVAVIALNRSELVAAANEALQEADYGAQITLKSLQMLRGTTPTANSRRLQFRAEFELKATRALRADEGQPIVRIRTPSLPIDPRRPVDIRIDVEA